MMVSPVKASRRTEPRGSLSREQTMVHFACPKCGASLQASHRKVGKLRACPRCRWLVQVPREASDSAPFDEISEESEPAAVFGLPHLLRLAAWASCVAVVSYLAWPFVLPLLSNGIEWPESPLATAVIVQMLAVYIVARAVDSVTRR